MANDEITLIDWIPNLLEGLKVTLLIAALGTVLTLLLSVVLGLMARSHQLWVRGVARTVIEFFRGTSLVILLFWMFFALPILLGVRLDAVLVGVLAFGLNFGAYGAEVVRGSLAAVPRAQWEAATALNLTAWRRMRKVIWPQAIPLMIPPMNNLLILLLKSTPLLTTIALVDVMAMGEGFIFATGEAPKMYILLMVIYFIIAYAVTFFMKGAEVVAKNRLGQHPGLRSIFRKETPDDRLAKTGDLGAGI